jgi:5-methylcytosine-specific restriction endonuclease McrA
MMDKPKSRPRPWQLKRQPAPPMANRSRNAFYHTTRWKKESTAFRKNHPLCARCEKIGLVEPSEMTDHIIPLELCEDPWDQTNWQALSKRCNNIKAAEDKKLIQQHRKNNPK